MGAGEEGRRLCGGFPEAGGLADLLRTSEGRGEGCAGGRPGARDASAESLGGSHPGGCRSVRSARRLATARKEASSAAAGRGGVGAGEIAGPASEDAPAFSEAVVAKFPDKGTRFFADADCRKRWTGTMSGACFVASGVCFVARPLRLFAEGEFCNRTCAAFWGASTTLVLLVTSAPC